MSQLLSNINSIISTFEKYAKKDGDCATLSKGELKQLIQKEFAEVIVNPCDPETTEKVLRLLDTDCDGKVDFEEFTVLVFKVAKACYKKVRECQAPAEGQPRKAGSSAMWQDVQPSSKNVACQNTKKPEKAPSERVQCPSQEQEAKPPKPERCNDGQMKPAATQDEELSYQISQKPSVKCPVRREAINYEIAKEDLTCQGTHMERKAEQGCTQDVQPEYSAMVKEASHQCPQEPLTPDEEPSQEFQQSTTQPCRMEEQGHADQEKVEDKKTAHQWIHEVEQTLSQRQSQERSTHRSVQECQASEQRSTDWPIQDPQANWALSGHQEERLLTSEQCLTSPQEQKPHIGEWTAWRKQSKPQMQEQGPACKPEDDLQEGQGPVSSQQQPKEAQGPEQTQTCQQDHETLRQHPTGQQEHRPRGLEQIPTTQQRRKPQGPQQATSGHSKCPSLTVEEHQPQKPGQSQLHYHVCQPLSPEQDNSPGEETERDQTCEVTELRGPRESSGRQPFKTSWSQQSHKPLQFPTPWSSKQ